MATKMSSYKRIRVHNLDLRIHDSGSRCKKYVRTRYTCCFSVTIVNGMHVGRDNVTYVYQHDIQFCKLREMNFINFYSVPLTAKFGYKERSEPVL